MFCSHCGKKIPSDSQYCPYCGSKVTPETDASANPTEEKKRPEDYEEQSSYSYNNDHPLYVNDQTTHTFAILRLVFGALGGLLGPIFAILVLSRKPSNQDKAMAIVSLSVTLFWFILGIVYAILIAEGKVPNPYAAEAVAELVLSFLFPLK